MTGAVNQILGRFKTWSVAPPWRPWAQGRECWVSCHVPQRGELQSLGPVWGHQPQSGATCDAGLTTDLGRENSTRGQRHQGGHRYVIIQGAGEINQCDKAKTLQDNDDNKSDKIELKREEKCRTNVGWNLFTVTLDILCIFIYVNMICRLLFKLKHGFIDSQFLCHLLYYSR